jgi:hypothetical protein
MKDLRINSIILVILMLWTLIWVALAVNKISSLQIALRNEHEKYLKVSQQLEHERYSTVSQQLDSGIFFNEKKLIRDTRPAARRVISFSNEYH